MEWDNCLQRFEPAFGCRWRPLLEESHTRHSTLSPFQGQRWGEIKTVTPFPSRCKSTQTQLRLRWGMELAEVVITYVQFSHPFPHRVLPWEYVPDGAYARRNKNTLPLTRSIVRLEERVRRLFSRPNPSPKSTEAMHQDREWFKEGRHVPSPFHES